MKLIASSWSAKQASIAKAFVGGTHVIKVGRKKFRLPADIAKTEVAAQQNEMTALRMIVILALALSMVGLVLAIPLYFIAKRKRMTLTVRAKTGETFTVATSRNAEWRMLRQYAGIGALG